MNTHYIFEEMERNGKVFKSLLNALPEKLVKWRPAPEKWSLLEVVCHLYDEEREDFRARVKHTLETPEQAMAPIDPSGWVNSRNYAEQEYSQKLVSFLEERKASVAWLRSLNDPHWDNLHEHPIIGPISARKFLSNWLAHDYLHFRQITRLKYEYLRLGTVEDLQYAGDW